MCLAWGRVSIGSRPMRFAILPLVILLLVSCDPYWARTQAGYFEFSEVTVLPASHSTVEVGSPVSFRFVISGVDSRSEQGFHGVFRVYEVEQSKQLQDLLIFEVLSGSIDGPHEGVSQDFAFEKIGADYVLEFRATPLIGGPLHVSMYAHGGEFVAIRNPIHFDYEVIPTE